MITGHHNTEEVKREREKEREDRERVGGLMNRKQIGIRTTVMSHEEGTRDTWLKRTVQLDENVHVLWGQGVKVRTIEK